MIQLPDKYRKNSYDFKLVERQGDVAIYEQIDPDTNRRVAYEVYEVIKRPERVMYGSLVPANEKPPANEEWGKYGFTVWTLEAAKEKMELLRLRIEQREAKTKV